MLIYFYGDSNTYGFDPRSYLGGRYPAEHRWVDIFAKATDCEVINAGENGRKVPRSPIEYPAVPADADVFAVMLGTNDLLHSFKASEVATRMEAFLTQLGIAREKLLLIAPPPMCDGDFVADKGAIPESFELAREYSALAEKLGIYFADSGQWNIDLTYDGVHFSEAGHAAFAEGLGKLFTKSIFNCTI